MALRTGGELVINPWTIHTDHSRPLELHRFNIRARFVNAIENLACRVVDAKRLSVPRKIINAVAPCLLPKYVRQKKHGFDPKVFDQNRTVFLDGWWQSELYFREHRDLMLSELSFRERPDAVNQGWLEKIRGCNSVCVHVRRGDYLTDEFIHRVIGVCSLEYYQAAFSAIRESVSSPEFFVFSDDPEWTRQNLPVPEPRHFISHNCGVSDHEDLRLMSACKHFIIANSTFSWWGAWLSTFAQKQVIAPKRWFASTKSSTKDIVPADWTTL
jgi:hypothetical protein